MSESQLEAIETASRDELMALQLSRLRWSLNHAYQQVPAYRAKFQQARCHPDDLQQLEDLAKFPFTTKQDLRQNYPYGMFAVPMEQVVRIHASSGTTGQPTVVGYTRKDIDTWSKLVARSIRAAGGTSADKVQIAFGYGLFTGGLGAHYGAEQLGCTVIPLSGGQTDKQARLLRDFGADIIMATPSYVLSISDALIAQGIDPQQLPLRLGIFGAEPWTEAMRTEIEQRLGINALDIYGLSEVIGPGVAMECLESKDGPTLWEDHFYPEIIDPNTSQLLAEGQLGELVLTSLTKEALPVIRYRTRDLTRLLPGTARTMRRMARITGRSDDMLIIRGVNVFPTQIEEQILSIEQLAPHYQLHLSTVGHLDHLKVQVEINPHIDGNMTDPQRQSLADRLQAQIKSFVGINATISLLEPGKVQRSEGKAQRVVDQRS